MNDQTKSVTVEEVINPQDLMEHTAPKINRRSARARVKSLRRGLSRARARYAGGMASERQSLTEYISIARRQCRQAMLSSIGRKMDLLGLLGQRKEDGNPVWALVNPLHEIGKSGSYTPSKSGNGYYSAAQERDGQYSARPAGYHVSTVSGGDQQTVPMDLCIAMDSWGFLRPGGMPALPARVRRLVASPKIQKRAAWIGVLYQPAEWQRANPDPALVVEWRDLPGEYFALAIWGPDYPRIMEFVH